MSKEEIISCDNDNCQGGKYFRTCGNGHDICSLCWKRHYKKYYCPICLKKAELLERK